jgi:hypothetical protein
MHPFIRPSSSAFGHVVSSALTSTLLCVAGSAQAGQGVFWSVNVNAPIQSVGHVATTFSNTPRGLYGPAPVVIAPQVVYAPVPVYVQQPAYVQREPEYRRCSPPWAWHHRHPRHEQRYEGRHERRYDGRYAWGDND